MNAILATGAAVLGWSMYQHNAKTAHVTEHSEKHSLFNTVVGPWWEHSNEDLSVPGASHTATHKSMQQRNERMAADHPATNTAHVRYVRTA